MADWVHNLVRRIAGHARGAFIGSDNGADDHARVRREEIQAVMMHGDRFCRLSVDSILGRWSRPVPPDERHGDLMQVARLALHKAEISFDHARGRFPDFAAHRIVWDLRDYLESRSAPRDDVGGVPEDVKDPADVCGQATMCADVSRAIDGLDAEERDVLRLWLAGVSDDQIGARTGMCEKQVQAAQKRWRRRLAKALPEYAPVRRGPEMDGA